MSESVTTIFVDVPVDGHHELVERIMNVAMALADEYQLDAIVSATTKREGQS